MTSHSARRCVDVLVVATLLLVLVTPGRAQERRWSFDVQLGAAVPTGGLADLEEPGPALEAGGAYALSSFLGVTLDGALDFLLADSRRGPDVPDLRLWHYTAGLEARLAPPRSDWTLRAGAAGGMTYVESDGYPVDGGAGAAIAEFGETYPSLAGSLRAGWRPASRVDLLAGVGARVVFFDDVDTAPLATLAFPDATGDAGFGTSATIPVHLRLRIRL